MVYFVCTMGIIFSSKQHADLLLVPCMEGNLDEVKRLIGIYIADHDCNSNSRRSSRWSSSSSDLLRSYINTIDPVSGNAAIHGAVFSGHLGILTFLVDTCCKRGAGKETMDLRLQNILGCTPLWVAAGYDRTECLQYLIEKLHNSQLLEVALLDSNSTGDTPFVAAVSRGNIRACHCLWNSAEKLCTNQNVGEDDESKVLTRCWDLKRKMLRTANGAGDTALKVAVASGQRIELVTLLLDLDDQCQEQLSKKYNEENEDAPRHANRFEDNTVMRSKCINRKNKIGLSPLIVACERNLPSIVELLLNHGADASTRDKRGRSPLAVAAFCGCNDVVVFLLSRVIAVESSLHLNEVDNNECTPLWLAARTGNLSMVKLLVDAGADVSLKNIDGMTPLDVAIKFKKEKVVEFLSRTAQ